jgi:hypothetical protein
MSTEAETVVERIEWMTGPSGEVSASAVIARVELEGFGCSHAAIGSVGALRALGAGAGSRVIVARADVLPRVVRVTSPGSAVELPTMCPACRGVLVENAGELLCKSGDCPPQVSTRLRMWLRAAGLGDLTPDLEKLVRSKVIRMPADLYRLGPEDWVRAGMPRERGVEAVHSLATHEPVSLEAALRAFRTQFRVSSVPLGVFASFAEMLEAPDYGRRVARVAQAELDAFVAAVDGLRAELLWLAHARAKPVVALPEAAPPDVVAKVLAGAGAPLSASRRSAFAAEAERVRERLGCELPDDCYAVFELACALRPSEPLHAFTDSLGLDLTGPFELLANAEERPYQVGRGFSPCEAPELVTVMVRSHTPWQCGYWVDDPGELPSWIVSFYSDEGYEPGIAGRTLFDVLRDELESAIANEESAPDPDAPERSGELRALRERILEYATADRTEHGSDYTLRGYSYVASIERRRIVNAVTFEGIGIVVPAEAYAPIALYGAALERALDSEEELLALERGAREMLARGLAGTALEIGKALWSWDSRTRARSYDLLVETYRALGRHALAEIVVAHREEWAR